MRLSLFISTTFLLFILVSCKAQETASTYNSKEEIHQKSAEDEAIKKVVEEAYRVISFKQGEQLSDERIKSCFIPQVQFINFRTGSLELLHLDEFISNYKAFIESSGINAFYEKELFGKTDRFGNIAQRLSTYETSINAMDMPAEKGVNSIQLIKTEEGWKISSIIWDVEKPGHPIPSFN